MVIIDQINCFNNFAKVFTNLGVPHVISFEVNSQNVQDWFKGQGQEEVCFGTSNLESKFFQNKVIP